MNRMIPLTIKATEENFNEEAYLDANPDVAYDVRHGLSLQSGRQHFEVFGRQEGRCIRLPRAVTEEVRRRKLERIIPLLKDRNVRYGGDQDYLDFLTEDQKMKYRISQTEAISSNPYDRHVTEMIAACDEGLILDCGAGRRDVYYDHVVNLEVVPYDTTDVLAAGEELPFAVQVFDAVISLSVLEHVRDPFQCAREMARVLKPGGRLICSVPFMQPYHGYPHHYYNMTYQGLRNLFEPHLEFDHYEIDENALPIWSLNWILKMWADGLKGASREAFLQTRIGDLLGAPQQYLDRDFVKELPDQVNRELAYATTLFAHKRAE